MLAVPWKRHRLRDSDVWAKVDGTGALVTDRDGRVEIVYKPESGAKTYRAAARNLADAGGDLIELTPGEPAPEKSKDKAKPKAAAAVVADVPANAIHVWTDGGANPNPGPAGIGVVIVDGDQHHELSEYLGQGTNQIAELTAILRGLQEIRDRSRPVVVYSDSAYSIGLLSQNWKAKANVELVEKCRAMCRQFEDLRFVKVAGHAGIALNERVDELATSAISRGR
ncbi:MAG: ribonuclease HI [Deltaproteobacteria bacterium]|nr:ribonuclease HI [Deltaproteobacteria bacterium]